MPKTEPRKSPFDVRGSHGGSYLALSFAENLNIYGHIHLQFLRGDTGLTIGDTGLTIGGDVGFTGGGPNVTFRFGLRVQIRPLGPTIELDGATVLILREIVPIFSRCIGATLRGINFLVFMSFFLFFWLFSLSGLIFEFSWIQFTYFPFDSSIV